MADQTKLDTLSLICSVQQVFGLGLIVLRNQFPDFTPDFTVVLIGISGFAAIVKYFIPGAKGFDKALRLGAAFAGGGIAWAAMTMI